jgi:hypothetical protein
MPPANPLALSHNPPAFTGPTSKSDLCLALFPKPTPTSSQFHDHSHIPFYYSPCSCCFGQSRPSLPSSFTNATASSPPSFTNTTASSHALGYRPGWTTWPFDFLSSLAAQTLSDCHLPSLPYPLHSGLTPCSYPGQQCYLPRLQLSSESRFSRKLIKAGAKPMAITLGSLEIIPPHSPAIVSNKSLVITFSSA